MKLLVVDDDRDLVELLEYALRREGYDVARAYDGESAAHSTLTSILAREAAVLIMPYADLPVTRAMQPLKLKEYLATEKPVVALDLPSVKPWSDCLDAATTDRELEQALSEAVSRRGPTLVDARIDPASYDAMLKTVRG